ncbi:MAG: 3-dehydroquinate synthase [Chitinophagales bacterium]|nr:3-dehydroquinate synthase [Chitinophagales bacterium]
MLKRTFKFNNASTDIYFDNSFSNLKKIVDVKQSVVITDENVFTHHQKKFKHYNTIVLKAGEKFKIQATVDNIIEQLIQLKADRNTILISIGGGMISDITGYTASIYMRGIQFGFVPTTILSIVDASIGGKNGINVGSSKNMIGTIQQPKFILHDLSFLNTLPKTEWQQGFAEIIKHACIKDAKMFKQLQLHSIKFYQSNKKELAKLIEQNVLIKIIVVKNDEFEKRERRILNFGHTIGHALEMNYELLHGQAVAIGMTYASEIAEKLLGFKQKNELISLLEQYELPTFARYDKHKILHHISIDKKKEKDFIHFILLKNIGNAVIHPIKIKTLEKLI